MTLFTIGLDNFTALEINVLINSIVLCYEQECKNILCACKPLELGKKTQYIMQTTTTVRLSEAKVVEIKLYVHVSEVIVRNSKKRMWS